MHAALNMVASDNSEEFLGEKLAMEASLNVVLPAEPDFAESWSQEQHVMEEMAFQQRLLDEAAAL